MSIGNLFGTGGESNSLYGTSFNSDVASSFIYFEWFIFKTSTGQPATPTGGSWNFANNTGVPPTGWTSTVTGVPINNLWFSIAFVDSRNPTNIVWSAPGLLAASTSVYATAYADTFTGNGSTVNWTLTTDPVVVNNLDVSINGVTQTPTVDYTISGTTFTTTTAAPLGSIILVKYRQALPNSYFGTANNVGYTPFSWIAATNVQAALNEVATDVSATDGVSGSNLVGYKSAGTGAVATTVQAKLRQTISVKDFGAVGDGTTNDTTAFANAIAFLDTTGGGELYIPDGIYMLDSLTMTGRSKALTGETMGSPTLTHGVILRCRSACSDFVTISGVGHRISNMFIDGNNLATAAVVRYTNNMTDVVTSNVIISGGVSGSILLALAASPQNNNAQVSELQFYGVLLAGSAGVTNLYINSDQAVVIAFYNLKSFSADYGIDLVRGTVTLYCPFFTDNLVNDIRAIRGQVTVFDGRSESSTIDSLSFTGSATFELNSYVHGATISNTTLSCLAGWTGLGTVVGGQYTNILNSSPTGTLVLVNKVLYSGGAFYGAYAYKSIDISGGYVKAAKTLSYVNVLTYGTTVSPDMGVADRQYVAVTNGVAFTIAAPANPSAYQTMYLTISNQSGGALGAITWNAVYKFGTLVLPATGFQKTISFTYDGASWIENFQSSSNVPN